VAHDQAGTPGPAQAPRPARGSDLEHCQPRVQDPHDADYALIAAIVGWFDLVAVQEVNDNLRGLRGVLAKLPTRYRTLYSDAAGNDERLAFIYDATKLSLGEEIGEISLPPSETRHIRLPGVDQAFAGFDRNPYVATFSMGGLSLSLVNVHLYFGSDSGRSKNRRRLET
jgi:endonuclease/exonuclease/phosphatase family metal-dependent hydrolase